MIVDYRARAGRWWAGGISCGGIVVKRQCSHYTLLKNPPTLINSCRSFISKIIPSVQWKI